ncbi:hypothetical protein Focb16_v011371 [Fusarium oxysporum f. sp. cubense]|uniref:Uncharacterized protein n=1 Tax=Fusarium oxysporum f. sp. cubense TaxID=61366 RepID=A0A559KZG5_FUSOC|nr:hypothetical protein Focb16_v011371 [Fusarium oxysporum f. sp. cubense]
MTLVARSPAERPKEPDPYFLSLPVREGGLGLPLHKELAQGLYQAAKETAKKILTGITSFFTSYPSLSTLEAQNPSQDQGKLAKEVFKELNEAKLETFLQDLPIPYKQARLENASYLGRKWLRVLPIQKPHFFTDSETTEALRSRLFYPIKPLDLPCSACGAIANLGHEDTCKGASRRWIARHNAVNRAFVKALGSRPNLEVEIEPLVQQDSSLRADFAVTIRNSRYFYDIQIVAISKDSAKEDPYSTLKEAASEKRRKYQSLRAFFHPLIFSAGGLMDQETSQTYKKLQELLGPFAASQLDSTIGLTLTKTRAISAASIARDLPRRTHS